MRLTYHSPQLLIAADTLSQYHIPEVRLVMLPTLLSFVSPKDGATPGRAGTGYVPTNVWHEN